MHEGDGRGVVDEVEAGESLRQIGQECGEVIARAGQADGGLEAGFVVEAAHCIEDQALALEAGAVDSTQAPYGVRGKQRRIVRRRAAGQLLVAGGPIAEPLR